MQIAFSVSASQGTPSKKLFSSESRHQLQNQPFTLIMPLYLHSIPLSFCQFLSLWLSLLYLVSLSPFGLLDSFSFPGFNLCSYQFCPSAPSNPLHFSLSYQDLNLRACLSHSLHPEHLTSGRPHLTSHTALPQPALRLLQASEEKH